MLIGGHGLFSKIFPNEPKCVAVDETVAVDASYLTTKHLSYLILISLSLSLFFNMSLCLNESFRASSPTS